MLLDWIHTFTECLKEMDWNGNCLSKKLFWYSPIYILSTLSCRHTLTFTDVFSDLASALNVRIRSSRSSSSSNNNWKIDILDIVRAARWWCSYTGQIFYQQVRSANKKWPLVFIWYFTTTNIFYLFKQHLICKKCPATCRWRNVSDFLISSSFSWQSQWFSS